MKMQNVSHYRAEERVKRQADELARIQFEEKARKAKEEHERIERELKLRSSSLNTAQKKINSNQGLIDQIARRKILFIVLLSLLFPLPFVLLILFDTLRQSPYIFIIFGIWFLILYIFKDVKAP